MPPVGSSTIPAFRAALKAMLDARYAAVLKTPVTDGPPSPATLAGKEFVALMTTEGEQIVRAMNRVQQPRDERYTQEIEISVVGATRSDQVTVGNRAYAIFAELELGIRADTVLAAYYAGPGHIISITVGREKYQPYADDKQRESRLNVWLNVHARIS